MVEVTVLIIVAVGAFGAGFIISRLFPKKISFRDLEDRALKEMVKEIKDDKIDPLVPFFQKPKKRKYKTADENALRIQRLEANPPPGGLQ
jgi:hypothetical protein